VPLSSPKWLLPALAAIVLLGVAGYLLLEGGAEPPPPPVAQPPPQSTLIVLFETEPPGALVVLDGRTLGIAPLTVDSVTVGEHEVKGRMEGRPETTQIATISPEEGEPARVMIVLPAAPEEQPPAE
jgi:serine/threonine-protein kinase